MATKTLTDKLEAARVLIFNSRDPEVAPLLDAIGVSTLYIDDGEALYNEAMDLVSQQKTEYQEQYEAYDNFYLAKDAAEEDFRRTLKLVKVLSRNDEDLQSRLNLPNNRTGGIESWIENTILFYNSLLNEADFLARLNQFNITTARLTAERDAINELKTLRNKAVAEKGDAQEATRLRNEKLEQLSDYSTELRALAEVALEGRPQLLEKLGILVRS